MTDFLSYLNAANESEGECLAEHKDFVAFFTELDEHFRTLVTGHLYGDVNFGVSHLLAMNAHASFLASAAAAVRGQFAPTFMIIRGSLESALYSFIASLDKKDAEIWLKRTENLEACRNLFTVNRAVQKLSHDPNLASAVRSSHQWLIEFGAHPNPRSILENLHFDSESDPNYHKVSLAYIGNCSSVAVVRCLSACVENGAIILSVLVHAFAEHPKSAEIHKRVWVIFNQVQATMIKAGYLADEWVDGREPR